MSQLRRLAFIGNALPRRCGIATFTTDLYQAVVALPAAPECLIVAMSDHDTQYPYPASVRHVVRDQVLADYIDAAAFLNGADVDVVCLQHEFGIFGGEAGGHILALLSRLTMPIVTTLHTVLASPSPAQHDALCRIAAMSARVVVMAEKGRTLLRSIYAVPSEKIEVIPHGIPDAAFAEPASAKAKCGFANRSVILTFGLLSPNKGIEVVIDAMPAILQRCPDAVYVVLGATHPNLVRDKGETYRESLMSRAKALDVAEHVVLVDQFVDRATLLDMIAMSDVYVTPYLSAAQMTSGTLAYSFGLGKAVVSTRYWHAEELLADGAGILVPFKDPPAIAEAVGALLTDDVRRRGMRLRAYAASRPMTWPRTAARYGEAFRDAQRSAARQPAHTGLPPMRFNHLLAMCDDTGLFQHAIHALPDRLHGCCIDDNARALLLACTLGQGRDVPLSEALHARFASFVQHAFNPDTGRFRNFMGFDRQWREASGSEDSHARTLWALGVCAAEDASAPRRSWARALFRRALPAAIAFTSPRAWAFTLLGLDPICGMLGADDPACQLRHVLARRLTALLAATRGPEWSWFEDSLAYDNARLCQALLITGRTTATPSYLAAGLRSLRWLTAIQTSAEGLFRPVGTASFGAFRLPPRRFDQQPLEATATISACTSAFQADGDANWKAVAERAFAWFTGTNDLGLPLVDIETGACRDGLHPDRVNQNMGGESVAGESGELFIRRSS